MSSLADYHDFDVTLVVRISGRIAFAPPQTKPITRQDVIDNAIGSFAGSWWTHPEEEGFTVEVDRASSTVKEIP